MRVPTILAGVAAILLTSAASAGVTLNSARVGAKDTAALGQFYQSAFGLKEVNRIPVGGGQVEIFLNFGDTVEVAKANAQAQIVVMHRDSDDIADSVPHIMFNVTDMAATVASVKAAGGTVVVEPRAMGNSGLVIGFVADPVGNRIELLQPPKH